MSQSELDGLPPIKKRRPAVPVFASSGSSTASAAPPAATPVPPAVASTQASDVEGSSSAGGSSPSLPAGERSQGAAAPTAANGAEKSAAAVAASSKPAEGAEKSASEAAATSSKAAEGAEIPTAAGAASSEPAGESQKSAATVAASSTTGSEPSRQSAPAQGAADNGSPSEKCRGTATRKSEVAQLQMGPAPVYGFEAGLKNEAKGKAIALRLEPLKPGLPEFERVLGESRQSVLIGSNRSKVDINVSDDVVSKKHVSLHLIGIKGELTLCIVDHSTNGSYVNGTRLPGREKRFKIRSGDKLTIKAPELDEDFGWKLDFGGTVAFFTRG